MPNGYADAVRVFTKILKPPFALLTEFGHLSVVYVDDTYLQSESFLECMHNLKDTFHHTSRQITTYTNSKDDVFRFCKRFNGNDTKTN